MFTASTSLFSCCCYFMFNGQIAIYFIQTFLIHFKTQLTKRCSILTLFNRIKFFIGIIYNDNDINIISGRKKSRGEVLHSVEYGWGPVLMTNAINTAAVQLLLSSSCCVLRKKTLRLFPLLRSLSKQFQISVISIFFFLHYLKLSLANTARALLITAAKASIGLQVQPNSKVT